jgi:GT2 family glycosyltransferase
VRSFLRDEPDVFAPHQLFKAKSGLGHRRGWQLIVLRVTGFKLGARWTAIVNIKSDNAEDNQKVVLLSQSSNAGILGIKFGVSFFSQNKNQIEVDVYSEEKASTNLAAYVFPIPRIIASLIVLYQNFKIFKGAFAATSGRFLTRFRNALRTAGVYGPRLPRDYSHWINLFDRWPAERLNMLQLLSTRDLLPKISVRVYCADPSVASAALEKTLASVEGQLYQCVDLTVIGPPSYAATKSSGVLGDYIAVLQAGEIIPPHALLVMANEVYRLKQPGLLFGDEDKIDSDGIRSEPLFKPQPSLTMMCSGVLSRGVWLIKREIMENAPGGAETKWAECARIAAWFFLYKAGDGSRAHRIPYLLTHRHCEAEDAPAEALSRAVGTALDEMGFNASISPSYPLAVQWQFDELRNPKVTLVVPSTLRGETQLQCLLQILEKTSYPNFEMLIIVSQEVPLDGPQQAVAEQLSGYENVTVEVFHTESFNYSRANNIAASLTNSDFVCLLNDDVLPVESTWLQRMLGFFSDPACGIVGCKLLYPNLTVQHGGMIMGLAGLVEHSNRFLRRTQKGYSWRSQVDHEVSAVTGACLLVKRSIYNEIGGFDESFATLFNDVDFCLRVRERGYGVVFAATVEMIHYETLTFAYENNAFARSREQQDAEQLRSRWMEYCIDDPFYNPNLSLLSGSEWSLAHPPRHLAEASASQGKAEYVSKWDEQKSYLKTNSKNEILEEGAVPFSARFRADHV